LFKRKRNRQQKWRLTGQHVNVGTVRNGEDMGWDFITPLATVQLGAAVGVDGEALVGVDSDAEKTRVSLKERGRMLKSWLGAWWYKTHNTKRSR
jgi:hypothetical protein